MTRCCAAALAAASFSAKLVGWAGASAWAAAAFLCGLGFPLGLGRPLRNRLRLPDRLGSLHGLRGLLGLGLLRTGSGLPDRLLLLDRLRLLHGLRGLLRRRLRGLRGLLLLHGFGGLHRLGSLLGHRLLRGLGTATTLVGGVVGRRLAGATQGGALLGGRPLLLVRTRGSAQVGQAEIALVDLRLRGRGLGLGHLFERVLLGVGFLGHGHLGLRGLDLPGRGLARLVLVGVVTVAALPLGGGKGARGGPLLATLVCRGLARGLGVLATATAGVVIAPSGAVVRLGGSVRRGRVGRASRRLALLAFALGLVLRERLRSNLQRVSTFAVGWLVRT